MDTNMKHGVLLLVMMVMVGGMVHAKVLPLRQAVPPQWTVLADDVRSFASEPVAFVVALPQRNVDALLRFASAASDPQSPLFGRAMTRGQIQRLVSPPPAARAAVLQWLGAAGAVTVLRDYGDALRVQMEAAAVARAFGASLVKVAPAGMPTRALIRAVGGLRVPDHLPIDLVTVLGDFPALRRHVSPTSPVSPVSPTSPTSPTPPPRRVQANNQVIPEVARALSGVPAGTVASSRAAQGIVEFGLTLRDETGQLGGGGGGFQFSDLEKAAAWSQRAFQNVSRILGPFTQTNYSSNAESLLDLQYIMGVAPHAPTSYETVIDGWMYEWALDVVHRTQPALVYSLSYGTPEFENCNASLNGQPRPPCGAEGVAGYLARSDVELAKLAAMRISVLASSGDNGAPSYLNADCSLDDTPFPLSPSYPATSPWVTAVGGIALRMPSDSVVQGPQPPICAMAAGVAHAACAGAPYALEVSSYINGGITSGGGFSNYTAAPYYQKEAVAHYLQKMAAEVPPPSVFHRNNRAYPDVSQLATNVLIVIDGQVISGAGTSASAPLTAGLLSLVNAALLEKGLPPVGFVNPSVYDMLKHLPEAFVDVTVGSNNCTEANCCKYGFPATQGWDPSTGAGAIFFVPFLDYLETHLSKAHIPSA